MKGYLSLVLLGTLLLSGCNIQTMGGEASSKEVREEGQGISEVLDNHTISLKLYKELDKEGKNLVFSPYSVADCISLLYNAADGKVKEEMQSVIGLSDEQYQVYRGYDEKSKSGVNIANKAFYTDKDIKLNLSVLGTNDLQQLDLDKEGVKVINDFVAKNTNHKITNFLKDGQLQDSVLVLINAIYFNKKFDFKDRTIYWTDGEHYDGFGDNISLVNVKEADKDIDVIKLDYLEEDKSMSDYSLYIICDSDESEEEKADEYVKGLTGEQFEKLLDFNGYKGLKGYDEANFRVPNYEMRFKESLTQTLKNLGFMEAFNERTTDFDKLGKVYINDILQEAYIKTDKKGTEAAAVTGSIMFAATSMEPEPKKVKYVVADSEFVYVLKDNKTDVILFMGKVSKPEYSGENSESDLEGDSDMTELSDNKTDMDFYKAIQKKHQGENFVFSPYSIKDCFSIIEPSVIGETKKQMDNVLGFSVRDAQSYANYDTYANTEEYSGLKIANKAFINTGDDVNTDSIGNSSIEEIDMMPDGYSYINKYVEDNTNGKIQDLLKSTDIDETTSLVLVNAMHFLKSWDYDKGQINFGDDDIWYKAFKKDDFSIYFVKEDGDIDIVKLQYTGDPEEMAYSGNTHKYSMYLICDSDLSEKNNVIKYMDSMNYDKLNELLDFEDYTGLEGYDSADFIAPNFEVEYKESLFNLLVELGMTSGLLEETTDFEIISKDITKISDVIHGAYVKTDEKGTEAAASTAITMMKNMAVGFDVDEKIKHIVVDSPFSFIIKDDTADVILFMGNVVEPSDEI